MKPTNNIPAYRFQGYTDAWELRKLGDEVYFYNGRAYKQSELLDFGKYKVVRVGNFNTNEKWYYSNLELEDSKTIDTGDLIYLWATSFGPEIWKGSKSIYHYHIWKLIIQQVEKIDKNYLYMWLYQDKNKIAQNTNGSTMVHITKKMIESRDFMFPTLPEQSAIGTFFSTLDQHITLHQRKLDTLKEQKKTYLKLLFPAKGQTKPALRFQGFEDDWEEVKVADIFQVTRGQVLSTNLVCDTKSDEYPYPVYSSQTKNNGLMGFYKDYLFDTAITWTTDGANAGTVRFREGKFYSTNVNGVLLSDVGYSNLAISEILNTVAWKYVSKVGNPKLMNNIMSEIILLIPGGFAEQQVLSSFFQTLDQEIAQVEDKLASLKEMKKTLLRKLFVS
ncbi:restriction endonuclease subunit S [Streptococcus orisratti]